MNFKSDRVIGFKNKALSWKKNNSDDGQSPFAYALDKVIAQIDAVIAKEVKIFKAVIEDLKADHLYVVEKKSKNYAFDDKGNKQQSPDTLKKYNAEFRKAQEAWEEQMNVSGEYDIEPHFCKQENIPELTDDEKAAFSGFVIQ